MDVTLLYFEDCPGWRATDARLRVLASELDLSVQRRAIRTPEEAQRVGLRSFPTVLVDGRAAVT